MELLRELRKGSGKSQVEVSGVLGIGRSKFSRNEGDPGGFRLRELRELSQLYGYELEVKLVKERGIKRIELLLE